MIMNKSIERKTIIESDLQSVIKIDDHFYIIDKKDKICVLPYTISSEGLLDKIGVIKDFNYVKEEETLTILNDYISTDDISDLQSANRILYEIIGNNIKDANLWMYLGTLYSNMTADSPLKLYAVDISNIEIKTDEEVEEENIRKKFKMLDSSKVLQTDDILFLAGYLRLFNYFFVKSLSKQ